MAPGGGRRSRVPVPGRQARCVPSDGSGRRPRHFGGSLGARRAGSDGAGRAAWAPPSWVPGASALNPPRARGDRAAGLREQVSDHRGARALRPVPRPRQHASMDDGPLPSGIKVFTTCPDLLFSLEFVSGWRPSLGGGGMGCAVSWGFLSEIQPDPQVARVLGALGYQGQGEESLPTRVVWPFLDQ